MEHGEAGIQRAKRGAHRGEKRRGIAPGPEGEHHRPVGGDPLPLGQVDLWCLDLIEPSVMHVAHDPDDGAPGSVGVAQLDPAAQGILARPAEARESFVDQHHQRSVGRVRGGEQPPAPERDPHRLQVPRRDGVAVRRRRILRIGEELPLDLHPVAIEVST